MAQARGDALKQVSRWSVGVLATVLVATTWAQLPAAPAAAAPRPAATVATQAAAAEPVGPAARKKRHYRTPTGPVFNNPRGNPRKRFRIEREIVRAIDATQRREVIRFALYSFDRMGVARALVAARNRGVRVQILLNDHQDTKAMKLLRARLGKNRSRPASSTSATPAAGAVGSSGTCTRSSTRSPAPASPGTC